MKIENMRLRVGRPAISFIIPTLNEEESLPHVITSINKYVPKVLTWEIIVADNGSVDKTVDVAISKRAEVVIDNTATVGGLRNQAVRKATGHVLVFLDADILLTEEWGENIVAVYQGLVKDHMQVTGSRCGVPANPGWIERYWFMPLMAKKVKYINSGHLITTPELFWSIGGFDERLESGEDYAFGKSAAETGATIINNPLLAVVHEGYPKTLSQFIKREIWHGRGECKSLRTIKTSNVAIASILFMALHVIAAAGIYYDEVIGVVMIFLIGIICLFFSVIKHEARGVKSLIVVGTLYYFYFISRFLSCIPRIKYCLM